MRYEFKNLYVPSYSTSNTSAGDALPTEDITIAYEPIKVSYSRKALEFSNVNGGTEVDEFDWIELRPSSNSSRDTSSINDKLIFMDAVGPEPTAGLLLPAVQAAGFMPKADGSETAVWDDFILG